MKKNDIIEAPKKEVQLMGKRHTITQEQVLELEKARKANKNKNVDDRLKALLLFAEGMKRREIAEKTEFAETYISELVARYIKLGIEVVAGNNYRGNRRNMTVAEEAKLLADFRQKAEKGEMVEVGEIKKAYCEKVGHSIGGQQIYLVLKRHGWRKVMPRSQHPNKASEEAMDATKKLTFPCKRKRTNVWTVASD